MSDYISLLEFKNTAELIGFPFAEYDAQQAISAASAGINEYCGRSFTANTTGATATRYYTPLDGTHVLIDDLISCSTLATDYDGDGVYEQVWGAGDFVLEPLNAAADGKPYEEIRKRQYSSVWFSHARGSVKVTGVFGWPAVPAQVKEATTIMSMRFFRRAREAPFGVVGLGLDNSPVRIARVDPDVCFLLDNLVRGQGVLAA
jgi:hypothetical protein